MPIIGEILKRAIALTDKLIDNPDPKEAQIETLVDLLTTAKSTKFGEHFKFEEILKHEYLREAFAKAVPIYDYNQLRKDWWQAVIDGESDITWPGKPNYFAVTSGSTGAKKHIPVTDGMLKSIRRGGLQQIKAMSDFDLPPEFFEKEILLFGSSTNLTEVNGHLEGEISGISASQIPFWFEGYYRPGKEIASISDWDERVEALAKEAKNWDIGSISGIPSWIELMLKKVIAYHQVETIHDIWPNLQVFTSGGVAFEPYKKSFDKIMGKPITVIDTYLASEGYFATQSRKETDAMRLICNNGIYFEFVPFEQEYVNDDGSIKNEAPIVPIEDVEENVNYVLLISTVSGAWRYVIGDTIMFTDKSLAEIKITGRTKHFLNVVGSHLSVMQMNKAMEILEQAFSIDIKEFTVAAVKVNDEYIHRWYLGLAEKDSLDEKALAKKLDEILHENNKNYKVARSKALKGVEVKAIEAKIFTAWTEETNQKGGQVKVSRVMKEEEFAEWEAFVNKQN